MAKRIISNSSLSLMRECPQCFWLQMNKNIKRPSRVFPSLPGGVDIQIKRRFDDYREIPTGLSICHTCDVKACINPKHLFLGTHKDNSQDAVNKGRWGLRSSQKPGEDNGAAKLTTRQVKQMRRLFGKYSDQELSNRFGVCRKTINNIRLGVTWGKVA